MVTIRKGDHSLRVTRGAFLNLYKPMGYVLDGAVEDSNVLPAPGEGNTPGNVHEDPEEDLKDEEDDPEGEDPDTDEPEDEPEEDPEDDLDEKPLSEMNFKELKARASAMNIDINGMTSKKEVRNAILEMMEEE